MIFVLIGRVSYGERRLKAFCSLELELVMRVGFVCLERVSGVRFESSGEDEIHGRRGEEGKERHLIPDLIYTEAKSWFIERNT
jgi:hypothetical protein